MKIKIAFLFSGTLSIIYFHKPREFTAHSFQALIINFGSQKRFVFVKVVMIFCVLGSSEQNSFPKVEPKTNGWPRTRNPSVRRLWSQLWIENNSEEPKEITKEKANRNRNKRKIINN